MNACERQRAYRRRQRRGEAVLRVLVSNYDRLVLAYLEAGVLTDEQSRDRSKVARVVGEFVMEAAEASLRKCDT